MAAPIPSAPKPRFKKVKVTPPAASSTEKVTPATEKPQSYAVANVTLLKEKFVLAYKKFSTIWAAAEAIGVNRKTIQRWRADDEEFNLAVLAAHDDNTDFLKQTAFQRAIAGGDSILLMFLIKQRDPSFREHSKVELMGKDGGPIKTEGKTTNIDFSKLGADALKDIAAGRFRRAPSGPC